jgi:FkbM family methyltransferase
LTGDWIVEKINNPEKIKIVKIDVEGAELLVLRGFKSFLSSFNPFIAVEVSDYYKRLAILLMTFYYL